MDLGNYIYLLVRLATDALRKSTVAAAASAGSRSASIKKLKRQFY
jgi:hypothetical protein